MISNRGSSPFFESGGVSEDIEAALVEKTNKVLLIAGISQKNISSIQELKRFASSIFVAIYESMFGTMLEGIVRKPNLAEHYIMNAQIVVDSLSSILNTQIKNVTGKAIVEGDTFAISMLVDLFWGILLVRESDSTNASFMSKPIDSSMPVATAVDNMPKPIQSMEPSVSTNSLLAAEQLFLARSRQVSIPSSQATTESAVHYRYDDDQPPTSHADEDDDDDEEYWEAVANRDRSNRRFELLDIKRRRCEEWSRRHDEKVMLAKQTRFAQDLKLHRRSFELSRESAEFQTKSLVYRGLLNRYQTWRREDEREKMMGLNLEYEAAVRHMNMIKMLFVQRKQMMSELSAKEEEEEEVSLKTHEAFLRQTIRNLSSAKKRWQDDVLNQVKLKREVHMRREKETQEAISGLLTNLTMLPTKNRTSKQQHRHNSTNKRDKRRRRSVSATRLSSYMNPTTSSQSHTQVTARRVEMKEY